jgi:hemin uptake protein HemP
MELQKELPAAPAKPKPLTLKTLELFSDGRRLVHIEHNGEMYKLEVTSNNKLILKK